MICPICKENAIGINSLKILSLIDSSTFYCSYCGVYFRDPLPSIASTTDYYSSRYFRYPDNIEKEMARIQGSFLIHKLSRLPKRPNNIHYIEFGAGRGWVLSYLKNSGFIQSAVGFEPDSVSTQWGIQNLHVDLRPEMLDIHQLNRISQELPETNLISLIHVLEHLHNPIDILGSFKNNFRPHFLFLEIPDAEFEGPVMRMDTFPWSSMGQHFWSFSEKSLQIMLKTLGYHSITIERGGNPHYWERSLDNLAIWLDYFNVQHRRYFDGNFSVRDVIATDFHFMMKNAINKLRYTLSKRYTRIDLPVIRILAECS